MRAVPGGYDASLETEANVDHKYTGAMVISWHGELIPSARGGLGDAAETGRIDIGRRIGEMRRVRRGDGVQAEFEGITLLK